MVRQRPERPNQIKGWDFPVRQRKLLISLTPHSPARLTTDLSEIVMSRRIIRTAGTCLFFLGTLAGPISFST
jgi:hypothetical protein